MDSPIVFRSMYIPEYCLLTFATLRILQVEDMW